MGGLESAEMKSGSGSITPPSFFHSPDFLNAAGARFPGLPVHFFSRPRICRVGNRVKCRVKTVKKGENRALASREKDNLSKRKAEYVERNQASFFSFSSSKFRGFSDCFFLSPSFVPYLQFDQSALVRGGRSKIRMWPSQG